MQRKLRHLFVCFALVLSFSLLPAFGQTKKISAKRNAALKQCHQAFRKSLREARPKPRAERNAETKAARAAYKECTAKAPK